MKPPSFTCIFHSALIFFAECHGVHDPEAFADRVLDSMQKRERTERLKNPRATAYSLGRTLLNEYWRKRSVEPVSLSEFEVGAIADNPDKEDLVQTGVAERREQCLTMCMAHLTEREKTLLLGYYGAANDTDKLHKARKQLVRTHGLSSTNHLRVIVHRIHLKVDPCVHDCMKETGL